MAGKTLHSSPSILPLYLRAAAPLIPGASMLPFVPGGSKEIPVVELTLPDVSVDPAKLAAYAKVCGFTLTDALPPTYPHMLAFPLHMAVMADGRFPFGAVGLVHIENRIVQSRPISIGEKLSITVWPTHLEPHPRGRTFSLLTEVSVDGEKVWESTSTMLRRGGRPDASKSPASKRDADGSSAGSPDTPFRNTQHADDHLATASPDTPFRNTQHADDHLATGSPDTPFRNTQHAEGGTAQDADDRLAAGAEWRLPSDLGRRYAAVSGDRNPIHMHSLTAKPLGFPTAIAHGMWSKARCLAALQPRLPQAFAVDVRFRKPISLPSKVQFAASQGGLPIDFQLRRPKDGSLHLHGTVREIDADLSHPDQSNVRRK